MLILTLAVYQTWFSKIYAVLNEINRAQIVDGLDALQRSRLRLSQKVRAEARALHEEADYTGSGNVKLTLGFRITSTNS
jgi:hypothetical protein